MKKTEYQKSAKDQVFKSLDLENITGDLITGSWQTGDYQYHIGVDVYDPDTDKTTEVFVCVKLSACNYEGDKAFDLDEAILEREFELKQRRIKQEKKKKEAK